MRAHRTLPMLSEIDGLEFCGGLHPVILHRLAQLVRLHVIEAGLQKSQRNQVNSKTGAKSSTRLESTVPFLRSNGSARLRLLSYSPTSGPLAEVSPQFL